MSLRLFAASLATKLRSISDSVEVSLALFKIIDNVGTENCGLLYSSRHNLRLVKLRFFAGKVGEFKLVCILEECLTCNWAQVDLDLRQVANDWLVLAVFYALKRAQNLELLVALLILFDGLLTWIMVLLVAQQEMV